MPKYQKKDPLTHILDRPDMYIGSVRSTPHENEWILTEGKMKPLENCKYPDGLKRIFIEPVSNAIDNVWRSKKENVRCTKIKINIDQKTGLTSVWNDGLCIPIEKHTEHKIYNPHLIFGYLHTSSNYDDDEKRYSSGRNGLGVKLTNIFSTYFRVEILDTTHHKIYKQEWKDNMKICERASIRSRKNAKQGYTLVEWIPDFKRFGLEGYTAQIIQLYTKYIVDVAMLIDVNVYLNDIKLPVQTIQKYGQYFSTSPNSLHIKTKDCEVLLLPSDNGFRFTAFTNGVINAEGGVHLSSWSDTIFKAIASKFKTLTPKDIKPYFQLIIKATLPNPEFSDQSKSRLVSPKVKAIFTPTHLRKVMKWEVIETMKQLSRQKDLLHLKKIGKKTKRVNIENYDRANKCSSANSKDCTLILCEGLSAKTFAVVGIDSGIKWDGKLQKGRDWFGIYPLKGKLLNVKNASCKQISDNKEIVEIIKICGLKTDTDYTKEEFFKTLRYGKILIIADADHDGTHIASLILNVFHTLFPTVLKRQNPFLFSMKTPIIKLRHNRQEHIFYQEENYKQFLSTLGEDCKVNVKYYKGLGTSTDKEIKECFGKKLVHFKMDSVSDQNMNKVFLTSHSEQRKEWLKDFDSKQTLINLNAAINPLSISDFLDKQHRQFSIYDCSRSIPNVMDGLKTSQRKIIYSIFKKNLFKPQKPMKVAQLGGYVAEHTHYHHGENCLFDTIIKLTQSFVGSNNLPYLEEHGQFGSRGMGGKDAASARYIFTRGCNYLKLIFNKEDSEVIPYEYNESTPIEPTYYIPIIPMLLVNGSSGIGTAWSTNIPCYNPTDLIDYITGWLENKEHKQELTPFYKSFQGEIKKEKEHSYMSYGCYKELKNKSIEVNELPIGMWTDKYKSHLESLIDNKKIKSFKNYSTKNTIRFIIYPTPKFKINHTNLKLKKPIKTTNIVAFTESNKLEKFKTIQELINHYCEIRLNYYIKRKEHTLKKYKQTLLILQNTQRFIEHISSNKLQLHKLDNKQITTYLDEHKFHLKNKSYDYLLGMSLRECSKSKIQILSSKIKILQGNIKTLKDCPPKKIWLNELKTLQDAIKC